MREALALVGKPDTMVTERCVGDSDDAHAAGMLGSPTIRVDGRDPFAVEGIEPSLSCRLYRSEDGVEGAPSVAALLEVLQ